MREHGLRTGLFTSPHLTSVTERIVVDGEPLSPRRFVEVWEDVYPYVQVVDAELAETGQSQLSFFEVLTAVAFAAFADTPVDVAIVEVGMGGEWDSTNVVDAEVAVVTPVALDHERWLGSTLEEIATVKSGIVKEGATVVSAAQRPEVEEVLRARAERVGARLLREGVDLDVAARQVAVGGQLLDLRTPAALYTEVFLPLHGEHQAHNALLALGAVEAFLGGRALDGPLVEAAFADVTSPGRLEVVRSSPTVLVDAAHNAAGAEALATALGEAFDLRHLVGVVAIMADKDAEPLLAALRAGARGDRRDAQQLGALGRPDGARRARRRRLRRGPRAQHRAPRRGAPGGGRPRRARRRRGRRHGHGRPGHGLGRDGGRRARPARSRLTPGRRRARGGRVFDGGDDGGGRAGRGQPTSRGCGRPEHRAHGPMEG